MSKRTDEIDGILDDAIDYLGDGFRRPHTRHVEHHDAPNAASVDQLPVSDGDSGDAAQRIRDIASDVSVCTRCGLSATRTNTVPGEGAPSPLVLVIGEGPGADEDRTGRPFVGAAGKYLDKWLDAVGLSRERNCFIANIVKCRPPGNRDPKPDESEACLPYLAAQTDALRPRVILTLGRIAIQNLLGTTRGIGALRGSTYEYRGVPVIPTYHPSGVLRNPDYRRDVWDDLQRLKDIVSADHQ